jgi:hypothetical protein
MIQDELEGTVLGEIIKGYRRYLHMPDDEPACAMLGVVAADRMAFYGEAPWMLINGQAGGGKTTLLKSIAQLPRVHEIDVITEAGLLSASSKKDKDEASTGGLLRVIGDRGLILNMDFTSVLQQDKTQGPALAALRRIYDGTWSRATGTDGGTKLDWQGRVSFLAGVTPAIDRKYHVIADMGDRWVQIRLRQTNGYQESLAVANNRINNTVRQTETAELIYDVMASLESDHAVADDPAMRRITAMSTFTSRSRSLVVRDSHSGAVLDIPSAEAPTRIMSTISQMYYGLRALDCPREKGLAICRRVAMDSIPMVRRLVLDRVMKATMEPRLGGRGQELVTVAQIKHRDYGSHEVGEVGAMDWQVALTQLADTTVRRAVNDLQVHGVLDEGIALNGRDGEIQIAGTKGWRPSGWLLSEMRQAGWLD